MSASSPRAHAIVGLDFGTTYTSVARVDDQGQVQVLGAHDGDGMLPSVVAFPSRDKMIVGEAARERLASEPQRAIASPKRLIGRRFDEPEVEAFLGQAPYPSQAGPDGSCVVEVWKQPYSVVQLCSYIIAEAKQRAEVALGQAIDEAVITVPVAYGPTRIEATTRAAALAGFKVAEVIDEATAAAVANRHLPDFGGVIGVYDLGGGTFDFSLVDVSSQAFRVLATAGDTWLGGDDLDLVLAGAAANQFWRMHKVDLRRQAVEWQRLRFACEKAKRTLSVDERATINVPDLMRTASGLVGLELTIDRGILARASKSLLERTMHVCDDGLHQAGLATSGLSAIYLCGGSSQMPVVRAAVAAHFGVPVHLGVNPSLAVAIGAARRAHERR